MLALAQQAQDSLRMPSLSALSARSNDLQVRLILAHQRNSQTSHNTAEQNQRDGNAKVDVQVRVARIFRQFLLAFGRVSAGLQQRHSARERQHHELRESEDGGSKGGRAISIPLRRRWQRGSSSTGSPESRPGSSHRRHTRLDVRDLNGTREGARSEKKRGRRLNSGVFETGRYRRGGTGCQSRGGGGGDGRVCDGDARRGWVGG